MTASLAGQAVRGTAWLGLVNVLSKGSQIAVTLALGVFVPRADVGAVTIAVVLVNVGVTVQLMGVYDVVSRTRQDPERFAGSVASLSVLAGTVVATVLVAGAGPIAGVIGSPRSAGPLRVAALGLPFLAYAGAQMALLHRRLDFRRRMLPDAGSALVGATVTIVLAARGYGAWSVVVGMLTTAVLSPLLGLAVGVRIPLRWNGEHLTEVLSWVRVVGPGSLLGVLLLNVDYVVVTRALGEEANGLYSYAYRFAFVPYIMIAVVLSGVAFPVYTRLVASGGPQAVRPALARFVHVLLAGTGGVYVLLALLAPRIVVVGPQWAPSAPVLAVLCGYGVLFGLALSGYDALRAVGRPHAFLALQAAHLVLLVVLAVAFVGPGGIVGVAWAQVVAAGVVVGVIAVLLVRERIAGPEILRVALGPLLAGAATWALYAGLGLARLLPADDSLPGLLASGVALAACYAGVLVAIDRSAVRELRELVR